MSRIKIWTNIPDQSALHVRVEGGTGTAQGILTVSDGSAEDLKNAILREGAEIQLRAPSRHKLLLVLTFAEASTMTVKADVEKPGGEQHGKLFETQIAGAAGEVKVAEIKAFMLKEVEG